MNGPLSLSPDRGAEVEHVCSAKGCRATGVHAVIWNNPVLAHP